MTDKHLHIVTHDIPFPVIHGGLVDLYHKIVALHAIGVKIHLHCFKKYNQTEQPELQKYCVSVNYYKRTTGLPGLTYSMPYIVSSRKNKRLVEALCMDDYPIIVGGIHCSALLLEPKLKGRKFLLRLYNVEHKYYRQLGKFEKDTFKKIYFYTESKLLEKYEAKIARKARFACLSEDDTKFYKSQFNAEAYFLPVFIPYKTMHQHREHGMYCLYHANLAVSENHEAVEWLLNNVFDQLNIPFVIAGRNPSRKLTTFIEARQNACLIANPSEAEMQDLIQKAQVNILPSFNNTGVKLKLINALFNGGHCIVNKAGVLGSGVEDLCTIAETAADFQQEIKRLFDLDFDSVQISMRQKILDTTYNNEANAKRLMSLIL